MIATSKSRWWKTSPCGASAACARTLDSKALVAPVENALRAKIPVVIIDSGLQSDKPMSYVSTDNFPWRQIAGEHLGKLLNGQGKVILLRYQVGSAAPKAARRASST